MRTVFTYRSRRDTTLRVGKTTFKTVPVHAGLMLVKTRSLTAFLVGRGRDSLAARLGRGITDNIPKAGDLLCGCL
jgi:hypothetical protein